jgi:pimeloyl-ACP methyl ester carboxylesterase
MRMRRPLIAFLAAALAAATLAATSGAQAAATVTVTPLHFKVNIGPTGSEVCDIVGDLYTPLDATPTNRVPALLTTNGFGGSKNDQAGIGREFAGRGYAVLSYSGLGFGGSGCKITLDDPDWDGKAASQLVSYLGGKDGIAFTDAAHTVPAPTLDVVQRDTKDHAGHAVANDPRVGMVGGSYGGQVQFAAAAVDKRVDTIVPIITWSDLPYSFAPNNTSQTAGVQTSTSGAAKLVWALGFSGKGVVDGVTNVAGDPGRLIGCPNFAFFVCPTLVTAAATGTLDASATASLRHASVSSYVSKVTIPTLVIQGENDTLFNLNEGIANYRALQNQGTPTKMIWFSGGHSGTNAPGDITFGAPDPTTEHVTHRVSDWLDHYLKGASVGTGPEFAYFRDWVPYTGTATPAYGSASSYPVGTATTYYLSGSALTTSASGLQAATQNFLTPVAGIPTSTDTLDVVGSTLPLPEIDLPGTTATWTTAALTKNVDVVGSPSLRLQVSSPTAALTQGLGSTGQLVLFVKVLDVDPAGTATLIHNLIAPVRVPDVTKPFTVTVPAIAHRFAVGHQLRLVVAGGSTNYRGGLTPNPVSITTGSSAQALTLPVVN